VVVSLLQNLDAMNPHSVLLAATNHEHLLDPAIWRRFTYKIKLGFPGEKERMEMLLLFFRTHAGELDIESLAKLSEGITGADLRTMCHDAIRDAVVNTRHVDQDRLIVQLLQFRLKQNIDTSTSSTDLICAIRKLDPKYFTTTKIASLFGTAASTVSRKLKKKETNAK